MCWDDLYSEMILIGKNYSHILGMALGTIPKLIDTTNLIISKRDSMTGEHPENFVAAIWQVKSFRLTFAGIKAALTGYPDVSTSMHRTVWERAVRLVYMKANPLAAALGLLIDSVQRQIKPLGAEIEYRKSKGIDLMNFERNLFVLNRLYKRLCDAASSSGIDSNDSVKRFAKKPISDICRQLGIEKAYNVDYRFSSAAIHGTDFALDDLIYSDGNREYFRIGPIVTVMREGAVFDCLRHMTMHAIAAADLTDNARALKEGTRISDELQRIIELHQNTS